ncbi:DUF3142 domain-containing protein [Erwinia sorbitola]|uniref:DUF3142 domain-containing protein n=1 Tax=Erwinia sorbitola TaxID=2681984 RepID=A0ABW9R9H5_9GAMM|nr:DUF3142 domain-containing protein [Erwinia sorbitola]MTD26220.1 DUF3142 domain-containing protein [Erwinia sorbitola]
MGKQAQVLLVSLLLAALCGLPAGAAQQVNASDYQAFWLWSGVRPGPELKAARTVYLHQGEVVTRQGQAQFVRMGLPVSRLSFPQIWLTVRMETLDVPDEMLARIVRLAQRWAQAGNQVVGVQIDFDAATHRLDSYSIFLQRLRTVLPGQFSLGVTGLLDWAKTGNVATLNTLPVDELVIQSYQGRQTVSNYADYFPALAALRIPFRLGLVQHGHWDKQDEQHLLASPWYRGSVVFMLNAR